MSIIKVSIREFGEAAKAFGLGYMCQIERRGIFFHRPGHPVICFADTKREAAEGAVARWRKRRDWLVIPLTTRGSEGGK